MKTLVIHPSDKTTDFLIPVWKDQPDWAVIRSNRVTKSELRSQIKKHDRIVCMGHGCDAGLFRIGNFNSLMIDSTFVQLLREKDCAFIWCNSDVFFKKYDLKGFFTGMIISDADEALYCCVPFSSGDVQKANTKLTEALSYGITSSGHEMYTKVASKYVPDSGIESFNYNNFYFR
jgi:hypothetical protein